MFLLAAVAAADFHPVAATADVTTSNGKHYKLETCFHDPSHLTTRFIYPAHRQTFVLDGAAATAASDGAAPEAAGDPEKRIALGHNFHAVSREWQGCRDGLWF